MPSWACARKVRTFWTLALSAINAPSPVYFILLQIASVRFRLRPFRARASWCAFLVFRIVLRRRAEIVLSRYTYAQIGHAAHYTGPWIKVDHLVTRLDVEKVEHPPTERFWLCARQPTLERNRFSQDQGAFCNNEVLRGSLLSAAYRGRMWESAARIPSSPEQHWFPGVGRANVTLKGTESLHPHPETGITGAIGKSTRNEGDDRLSAQPSGNCLLRLPNSARCVSGSSQQQPSSPCSWSYIPQLPR